MRRCIVARLPEFPYQTLQIYNQTQIWNPNLNPIPIPMQTRSFIGCHKIIALSVTCNKLRHSLSLQLLQRLGAQPLDLDARLAETVKSVDLGLVLRELVDRLELLTRAAPPIAVRIPIFLCLVVNIVLYVAEPVLEFLMTLLAVHTLRRVLRRLVCAGRNTNTS
jgi:hypothetical protein